MPKFCDRSGLPVKRPRRGRAPPNRTHHGSDRAQRAARNAQPHRGRLRVRVGGRGEAGRDRGRRQRAAGGLHAGCTPGEDGGGRGGGAARVAAGAGAALAGGGGRPSEGAGRAALCRGLQPRAAAAEGREREAALPPPAPAPQPGGRAGPGGAGGATSRQRGKGARARRRKAPCGAGWERSARPSHGCGLGAALLPALRALRERGIIVSNNRSLFLSLTGPRKYVGILVAVVIEITLRKRYREVWSAVLQCLLTAVLWPGSGFR